MAREFIYLFQLFREETRPSRPEKALLLLPAQGQAGCNFPKEGHVFRDKRRVGEKSFIFSLRSSWMGQWYPIGLLTGDMRNACAAHAWFRIDIQYIEWRHNLYGPAALHHIHTAGFGPGDVLLFFFFSLHVLSSAVCQEMSRWWPWCDYAP
jgi:hypothetical protein